jgi:DsbC/DsbD-like thiol-disulfide interchange protein
VHSLAAALMALPILLFTPAPNQPGPSSAKTAPQEEQARLAFVLEHAGVEPAAQIEVGLTFELAKGWHTYGECEGDGGMQVKVKWLKPAAKATFGEWRFPAPDRHESPGDLVDFIYEDRLTVLLPVTVSATASPGDKIEAEAEVTYMVCAEGCVPKKTVVPLSIPVVAKGTKPAPTPAAKWFAEARARVPRPAGALGEALSTSWKGNDLTISVKGATDLAFMPRFGSLPLANLFSEGVAKGPSMTMTIPPPASAGESKKPAVVDGVLRIGRAGGKPAEFVYVTLPHPAAKGTPPPAR